MEFIPKITCCTCASIYFLAAKIKNYKKVKSACILNNNNKHCEAPENIPPQRKASGQCKFQGGGGGNSKNFERKVRGRGKIILPHTFLLKFTEGQEGTNQKPFCGGVIDIFLLEPHNNNKEHLLLDSKTNM